MAAKDTTSNLNDFVSSFKRKSPTASPEASKEDLPTEPETPMQVLAPVPEVVIETPAAPELSVQQPEEPVKQTGRKEAPATQQHGKINYAETFLAPVRERKSKAVYITEDAHRTINAIAQASDGTPLVDILGNIINHHFETYGADVRAFLADQEKKNKKRLLF